jgi:regulator of sigma E protease
MWFLAMLSANLAILNLLPIPLLDGGQLMLLGAEGVMGRRPSEGVIAITQWAGLILILGLMGLGFVNDIGRLVGP